MIIKEGKQRIKAKTTKVHKYDEKNSQFTVFNLTLQKWFMNFPNKNNCKADLNPLTTNVPHHIESN